MRQFFCCESLKPFAEKYFEGTDTPIVVTKSYDGDVLNVIPLTRTKPLFGYSGNPRNRAERRRINRKGCKIDG